MTISQVTSIAVINVYYVLMFYFIIIIFFTEKRNSCPFLFCQTFLQIFMKVDNSKV